tara:strand:+ start:100 stop:231 length:132 start_codon:yes stop_codon:yes gene_type:complete
MARKDNINLKNYKVISKYIYTKKLDKAFKYLEKISNNDKKLKN